VPSALMIDLLGDGYVAPCRVQNGSDGYERFRRTGMPFLDFEMTTPEEVSVFGGNDVAVNTWASHLFGN